MRFGKLFLDSWKDYKNNFNVFFKLFFIFAFIPSFIFFTLNYYEKGIVSIIFLILLFFLNIFMITSFIHLSLSKKKNFKEAISGGKKYFFKYFWFVIIESIFLIGLFFLLIIPGIIFYVYWIVAPYVLLNEKKGVLKSLNRSYNLIKKKWWKTLGYGLLMLLIVLGISFIFSAFTMVVNLFIDPLYLQNLENPLFLTSFISQIFQLGSELIITPLVILFFKNFYFSIKK